MDITLPIVLGLAWLGVVITHLPLPYPSDPLNYLNTAFAFPYKLPHTDSPWQVTRYGLIIPARIATWIFGYSEAGYYLVPLLFTFLTLAATYALGTLLYSRWVGAVAALVVVTSMPMFEDAAALMPDMAATGLITAAVALAVAIRKCKLPARWWTYIALGILVGWSYEVREFIVFAWPLIPIILWRRIGWRGMAWLAGAAAVIGGLELLLSWALYGNPVERIYGIMIEQPNPNIGYAGHPRVTYLKQLPLALAGDPGGRWRAALLPLVPFGPLIAWRAWIGAVLARGAEPPRNPLRSVPSSAHRDSACPLTPNMAKAPGGDGAETPAPRSGSAGAETRPRYGAAVPLIWCALIWVPLTLEGGLLKPDDPAVRLELIRYWYPLFPAFVLGGLGTLWLAATWLTTRYLGRWDSLRTAVAAAVVVVVGLGAVLTSVAGTWHDPEITGSKNGRAQMAAFRGWLHRNDVRYGAAVLWTDSRTDSVAEIYRDGPFGGIQWHTEMRALNAKNAHPARGDLVLLIDMGPKPVHACDVCRRAATKAVDPARLPRNWRPVFTPPGDVLRVYRVAA